MTAFDPRLPEFFLDPHALLRRLRESEPVHRSPHGFWVLTRYRDVAAGLRSPKLGVGRSREQFLALYGEGPTFEFASRRFQYFDPPDHTRMRKLVSKAFTLRRIEAMRPRIRAITGRLFESVDGRREIELITDIAHPLPAIVICEMLGVPEADQPRLSAWAATIPFIIAPVIEPERLAAANAAIGEFMNYVRDQVEKRRKAPGEDLLTALIAAEEDGDRLTTEELVATAIFLFSAGHHTTRNLVGNGLLALLSEPQHWERLVAEPSRIPAAVEECLRFEPPINVAPRRAREPLEFDGVRIPEGDLVFMSLPGANRDPERFADPDRFDMTRTDNDHVGFGGGLHHCLGASLARAETQILLATLVERYPKVSVADRPIEWRRTMTYRGLERLDLKLS